MDADDTNNFLARGFARLIPEHIAVFRLDTYNDRIVSLRVATSLHTIEKHPEAF